VANDLAQLARATPQDAAGWAHLDPANAEHQARVAGVQNRAREVLDHYGVAWRG